MEPKHMLKVTIYRHIVLFSLIDLDRLIMIYEMKKAFSKYFYQTAIVLLY